MAIPKKDPDVLSFGSNFSTRITATPSLFHLLPADATQYSSLLALYNTAYQAMKTARDAGNRSKPLATAKKQARVNFLKFARDLYSTVQADTGVADTDKQSLGILVKKTTTTPIPAPSSKPKLTIKSVSGWTVAILLQDSAVDSRRGRPPGTAGASVFSYAGAEAPADVSQWKFEGNTGKNLVNVAFPTTLPAGQKVFVTAFWFNNSKLNGPACDPVPTNLQGGGVSAVSTVSESTEVA